MVFCGEHHHSICIEIKIALRDCFRRALSTLSPELCNALSAETRSVSQFRREPRKQLLRNRKACAPARTLVNARAAKLATIPLVAKRAQFWIKLSPADVCVHCLSVSDFRRRET